MKESSYLPDVVTVAVAVAVAAVVPGLVLEVVARRLHRVVAPPAVRLVSRAGGHSERGRGTVLVLQRIARERVSGRSSS